MNYNLGAVSYLFDIKVSPFTQQKLNRSLIIKGNFAEGNFGDDALLMAFHQMLNNAGVSSSAKYDCEYLAYNKDLAENAQIFTGSVQPTDIIIYAGGTQFFSFESKEPSVYQFLKSRISAYIWKKRVKQVFAMVGIGLGPFHNKLHEVAFASAIVEKAHFIWVRDALSLDFCSNLNKEKTLLGADLCFLSKFQQWCGLPQNDADHIQKIGIILRDWRYGQGSDYINDLIQLPFQFDGKKYAFEFYLFSENNDPNLEKTLINNNLPYTKWSPGKDDFKDYLRKLQSCDLFVTSRYHGAVFSTLMNKPFVIVGLEQKLTYFASLFDQKTMIWTPGTDIAHLVEAILYIDRDYPVYKNRIIQTKKLLENSSDNVAESFFTYLRSTLDEKA